MLIMRTDKTTYDEWNRTTKPRKIQNGPRKRKLQIIGNIGRVYHQTRGDEKKLRKSIS